MNHFEAVDGVLHAEAVPLPAIAAAIGTPFYCYATATLTRHYRVFAQALDGLRDPLIAYAVKANPNLSIIGTLAKLGAGADVVSAGEIARARAAGIPPERIVFAGVGKTTPEIAIALDAGILQFNCESEEELGAIAAVARDKGVTAPVAIRVNPGVDAETHAKITTGTDDSKFGIPLSRVPAAYALAASTAGLAPVGVGLHIGSQLTSLDPLESAFGKLGALIAGLRGSGFPVHRADLGGGLGVSYRPELPDPPAPPAYGAMVARVTRDWNTRLIFEPGRMLVGNAGVLVARVVTIKRGAARRFLVVDAAMNDLLRPTLYDAWHEIVAVEPRAGAMTADVVGPVCESGDTFAENRALPALEPGDLVAFRTAGAYGAAMSSSYNSRPLIPEVLVSGDRWAVVRPRQTIEQLLSADRVAPWLETAE